MENATNQSITGNTCGHINKTMKTLVNSSRNPDDKINKFNHKVKIIGDSHLRGLSVRLNKYLNTKFEVCSFLKPGTSINQIVNSQEMEFKCLGKKDVIIITGGSYDIDTFSINRNRIVVMMTEFMLKYNNTNIILVNIPHRYDLANDSKVNL
jgi:hypothetical protein